MNPQYYIKITPEKERELFEFIIKECNGVIFGLSDSCIDEDDNLCEYVDTKNIKSNKYLISYKHLHENQIISNHSLDIAEKSHAIIDGLKYSFWEDNFHAAPYIEYERDEEMTRIFVYYSGMTKKSKELLSPLYNTIRKWVKKNAAEIEKMDILNIYHIR